MLCLIINNDFDIYRVKRLYNFIMKLVCCTLSVIVGEASAIRKERRKRKKKVIKLLIKKRRAFADFAWQAIYCMSTH